MQKEQSAIRERASQAGAKYRALNSNWRNGIVGVDEPGLKSEVQSVLYDEQSQKVLSYQERH